MRVLILGCGYVGSELASRLLKNGTHEVWVTSRSPEKLRTPELEGSHPIRVDLSEKEPFNEMPAGSWDMVFQSISSGRGGPDVYRRVYLEGVRKTRRWLRQLSPEIGGWIYTSSTSVYGQLDGSWVDETSPTEPGSETASILLETEKELIDAYKDDHLPVQILRLSGIYGPERGFLFQQFLNGEAQIARGESRYLNMVHRDDVVSAALWLFDNGQAGEIYNVSDRDPVTRKHFLEWLASRLNREKPPEVDSGESAINGKRGVTNKRISSDKLVQKTGYSFIYPDYVSGFESEMRRIGLI